MLKNKIIKYIMIYVIFIVIAILSLTLASTFSSEKIYENVKKSSEILLSENNYKMVYIPYKEINMPFNNFTDALMINTSYSIDNKTPLYSAFVARKNYIPAITTEIYKDSVGELKSSSKYKYHNEVGELNDLVNGEKVESFEYARYWHGWLIVLRPLLIFFDLSQIRILLTVILCILACVLIFLLAKRTDWFVALIFLIGLVGVDYFYLGFSLEDVFAFLIAVTSSIILLLTYKSQREIGSLFFITALLTNFFDFLTVPLVTLAIPLVIYLLLLQKEKNINLKEQFYIIIKFCVIWGIGYGLTWFTKWLLVDLIYNKNLITTAVSQALYRSGDKQQFYLINVFANNIKYWSGFYVAFIYFMFFGFNVLIFRNFDKIGQNININIDEKEFITKILPFVIIGIMPFVWYGILRNHSYNHSFFTYRNLIVTIVCIGLCLKNMFELIIKSKNDNIK